MSDLKLQKIPISSDVINGCIADMLKNAGREGTRPAEEGLTSIVEKSNLNQDTGYSTQLILRLPTKILYIKKLITKVFSFMLLFMNQKT